MIVCVVASSATSTLWGICTVWGIPPIFMGEMRLPPCDNTRDEGGAVSVSLDTGQEGADRCQRQE
jgi:hypothetical protein